MKKNLKKPAVALWSVTPFNYAMYTSLNAQVCADHHCSDGYGNEQRPKWPPAYPLPRPGRDGRLRARCRHCRTKTHSQSSRQGMH